MEKNKRACKICKVLKDRILDGKFDHINKRWVDETGLAWNGNVCPPCNRDRMKNVMRKIRSVKDETTG
jgi:hypothetical protein